MKKTGQLASNERFLINMKKCKYGYAPDRDSTIDGQIEIPNACGSSLPLDDKLKESKKILEFIKECLRQQLTFDEAKELLRMTDVI